MFMISLTSVPRVGGAVLISGQLANAEAVCLLFLGLTEMELGLAEAWPTGRRVVRGASTEREWGGGHYHP